MTGDELQTMWEEIAAEVGTGRSWDVCKTKYAVLKHSKRARAEQRKLEAELVKQQIRRDSDANGGVVGAEGGLRPHPPLAKRASSKAIQMNKRRSSRKLLKASTFEEARAAAQALQRANELHEAELQNTLLVRKSIAAQNAKKRVERRRSLIAPADTPAQAVAKAAAAAVRAAELAEGGTAATAATAGAAAGAATAPPPASAATVLAVGSGVAAVRAAAAAPAPASAAPASAAPAPAPAAAADPVSQQTRTVIVSILEKFDPEKVKDVDALLALYAGREAALFDELRAKYAGKEAESSEEETEDEEDDSDSSEYETDSDEEEDSDEEVEVEVEAKGKEAV
jgi:hypothetical protein